MLAFYLSVLEEDADRALFVRIYEKYERRLYAVALHILGSPQWAEDAVQDAMVRIANHFDTAKKISSESCDEMESWCVTIVKRSALDILRKERHTVELAEDWDLSGPDDVQGQTAFQALVGFIRTMPQGYRAVLELRLVEEWSFREIGRAMGLSEGTVRTRFHRGREALRERLREEGYGDDE